MSQELIDLGYNSAFILLSQAFTGYFQDKTCRYLIGALANPEQTEVPIKLLRHLVAFVLQTVEIDSLYFDHRDSKVA